MGGKKPLRRPLWPPTRATASNYYPLGLDGAGGAAKPLLRAPKKPAPLHGRLPAFSGAVDAFERARKCFLEWRYFFSIILSEFLKNRVALHLQTDFLLPLIYPVVRDGKFKAKFLQKRLDKCAKESGDYVKAFLKMFGEARPYVTMQSCKNQFYSDLITPLPDKIHVPGTEIHIFYALKMGAKYRARYQQHFAHPVLHEQNLQHEELLACHPEQWAHLVKSIAL